METEVKKAKAKVELLPRAIIFLAVGGFEGQLKGIDTSQLAGEAEKQLVNYLLRNKAVIDLARDKNGFKLVFAKKSREIAYKR